MHEEVFILKCGSFHLEGRSLDNRELLLMFDNYSDGIAVFHEYSDTGQEGEETESGGALIFLRQLRQRCTSLVM